MATLTPKELIKLASACRKAGIKSYKQGDVEFTLTDDLPEIRSNSKKTSGVSLSANDTDLADGEELSPEDLLFWSVGGHEESVKDS